MVDAPGSHAAGNRSRCGAVSWYVHDNENDTDGRIPEFPAGVTPERTDRTDREVVVKQKTRAGSIAVPLMVMLLLGGAIANPVPGVLKGLVVGAPVSHGNLTLFPLDGRATGSTVYATLDKAIRKGWVEVREKDGGDVNTVRVRENAWIREWGAWTSGRWSAGKRGLSWCSKSHSIWSSACGSGSGV